MACACMDVSSVESRRQNVSETPTSTRVTVSSDWKSTTVAISRRWMELRMLSLKHVTLAAQCANQRLLRAMIELSAETGDIDFDHIAELLPVVVIEMLQQFGFRDDGARTMREVLEHPVFHGGLCKWPPRAQHAETNGDQLQVPARQDRRSRASDTTGAGLIAGQND